jgi:hypothetical protein
MRTSFSTYNHKGRLNRIIQAKMPGTVEFIDLTGEETHTRNPAPSDVNTNPRQEVVIQPKEVIDLTNMSEECAITYNHDGRLNPIIQAKMPETVEFIDLTGEETHIRNPAPSDVNTNPRQELACRPKEVIDLTNMPEECAICDNILGAGHQENSRTFVLQKCHCVSSLFRSRPFSVC